MCTIYLFIPQNLFSLRVRIKLLTPNYNCIVLQRLDKVFSLLIEDSYVGELVNGIIQWRDIPPETVLLNRYWSLVD